MTEYEKEMLKLREKANITTKKMYKQIAKQYEQLYKDYTAELRKAPKGSINEVWIRGQRKAILNSLSDIAKTQEGAVSKAMQETIDSVMKSQENQFNRAASMRGLPEDMFTNMFTSMNTKVLQELLAGGIYKDGKGLSDRIWGNDKKSHQAIEDILSQGISGKKNYIDVSKELQKFLDPKDNKGVTINGKKYGSIDYRAYRLANTAISHSYQSALARVNKTNPFIDGIKWLGGHADNSCDICKDRNGTIYAAKENKGNKTTEPLPLDHPNGFCNNIPNVEDTLESIGNRLGDWVNGKSDSELDKWFKEHGSKYKGPDDIKKEMSKPKEETKISKPIKKVFNTISHEEMVKQTNKWTNSLSDAEKKEFRRYTTSYYKVINKSLREGKKLTESQKRLYDNMTGALKRNTLEQDIKVFRAMNLNAFGSKESALREALNKGDSKFIKDSLLGQVFEDKGFMSTTIGGGKSQWSGDIKMNINIPKGTGNGAYIQPISAVASENEYLLPPGTKLIIKSVEEKTGVYKLTGKEYKYIDMVLELVK